MTPSPESSKNVAARLLLRAKSIRDANPASAFALLREARTEIESLGASSSLADCLLQMGNCVALEGKYAEALDYFARGKEMYRSLEEQTGVGRCLRSEAIVYRSLSLYHLAADSLFRSLASLQDQDAPAETGRTLQNLTVVFSELGFLTKAIEFAYSALAAFERAGDIETSLFSLNDLVLTRARQLRDISQQDLLSADAVGAEALELVDGAISRAPTSPPSRITCSLHGSKAELLLALGRPDAALVSLETAQRLADSLQIPLTQARVTFLMAEAKWKTGEVQAGFAAAVESAEHFEALGARARRAEALMLASEIAASQGEWAAALDFFNVADNAGETIFREQLRRALWASADSAGAERRSFEQWYSDR